MTTTAKIKEYKVSRSLMRELKLVSEHSNSFQSTKIQGSDTAYNVIKQFYTHDIDIYESVFILLLNRANKTIGYAKISQGGVSVSVVDNKLVCKYAIESLASAVILAHNHPSNNLTPSTQDSALTESLRQCLDVFDINLLDHLILGTEDGAYYSFRDNGKL